MCHIDKQSNYFLLETTRNNMLEKICHSNFHQLVLPTHECCRKIKWWIIVGFLNFSFGISKTKTMVPKKNSSTRFLSNICRLGLPTQQCWRKIEWRIIEGLLNFSFSLCETKISQRLLLCCTNAGRKSNNYYFSLRRTKFSRKKQYHESKHVNNMANTQKIVRPIYIFGQ